MARLFVMCGIPGSGKSTWAKQFLSHAEYVSRDEIRFSLVKEDEEYFSKEDEVFETFIKTISNHLMNGKDVVADATHINEGSRRKLLKEISGADEVAAVVLDIPYVIALERNEQRKDTRAYVPRGVIRRMWSQSSFPTFDEGFNEIYRIDKNNNLHYLVKEG